MFEKMANGWDLAKQSLGVLKADKELLLFPILSGFSLLLVTASFLVPLWGTGMIDQWMQEEQVQENPLIYVITFAFYFANYFVIIFFNTALISCAFIRFNGENPTLGMGFSAAVERLPQILGWSLVSATVGFVLKMIESRSENIGRLVISLLGSAWGIITFFAVPVIVIEKTGPIDAVKRSVSLMKQTWGEAMFANMGLGFIIFIGSLLSFIPLGIAIAIGNTAVMIAGGVITAVLFILVMLISSAADAILQGALYMYAAQGRAPETFDEASLQRAFKASSR